MIKLNTILEKVMLLLVLFLFIFIPLFPKFPLLNISGTFVAIRIEDFLIALTIGIWIFYIIKNKKWQFFTTDNIGKSFLLFFLIGIFSLFSALFLTHTITFHLGLLHFIRRVEFMLLLPVVATIFTTRKRLILVFLLLGVTLFIVNIYALGQQYLDWPVISTTNSEFSKGLLLRLTPGARVNSTFAGHYDLAVFLASSLVFLSMFFFVLKKRWRILILLLSALSLYVLILTAARVSFVAVFIGLILALTFAKKKKYLILIFICLLLAAVYPSQLRDRFVSTVTINLFNLGNRYEGRNLNQQLENKLNIPTLYYRIASRSSSASAFAGAPEDVPVDIAPGEPTNLTDLAVYRSFQIRLNTEWPNALRAFYKNPFFGLGYSSLGLATDNDFLRSLGEVGILGTSAFILVLLSIWKKISIGLKKEGKLIKFCSAASLSLIIVFLINGTFIDVFEASKVTALFWMILGLNMGVLKEESQ